MTIKEVKAIHASIRRYLAIIRRWQDAPRTALQKPHCWLSRRGAQAHPVEFVPADLKGGAR